MCTTAPNSIKNKSSDKISMSQVKKEKQKQQCKKYKNINTTKNM